MCPPLNSALRAAVHKSNCKGPWSKDGWCEAANGPSVIAQRLPQDTVGKLAVGRK